MDYEFTKDQLLEIREYIEQAQQELRSCINCQPAGWDTDEMWMGGFHTDMQDLIIYNVEAPADYFDEIANFLVCPNCGADLSVDTDVGVSTIEENRLSDLWNQWERQYGDKYQDFNRHLENYPYLGLDHEIGRELFENIAHFPQHNIADRIAYRARISDKPIKNSAEMYPPPFNFPIKEGRYNHAGQRVFYLANSVEGAAHEALEKPGEIWVQKFKIKNATRIMDLTVDPVSQRLDTSGLLNFGILFGEFLSARVDRANGWKPEYMIPRFIADCAKKAAFNGIKYRSSRFDKYNLVLFAWQDDDIEPVGKPYQHRQNKISCRYESFVGEYLYSVSPDLIQSILTKFDEKHFGSSHLVNPLFP